MEKHDYMNDPRLDDMKDAALQVREVYAWRLAEQDAKRGMTQEQEDAYYATMRKEVNEFCAERGIKLKYTQPVVTV